MNRGLLLIGHGTRDLQGQDEFFQLTRLAADLLPAMPVEACFLELAEPTIDAAVHRLTARGATELLAAPLLLFAAGHAKQDIPAALARATADGSIRTVGQLDPLGCEPAMVALSALRFRETIDRTGRQAASGTHVTSGTQAASRTPNASDAETFLLLVGRGSRDAQASAEMARFARLRWEETPVAWCIPCFAAMTRPTLAEGLQLAARSGCGRIVVQPHLLFQGELAKRIAAEAMEFGRQNPELEVIVAPHLGPHPLLAELLAERVREAEGGGGRSAAKPPATPR